jgi:hypothetical protein
MNIGKADIPTSCQCDKYQRSSYQSPKIEPNAMMSVAKASRLEDFVAAV